MKKTFESFLNLFSPFYYGAQTLDFIKENSKKFLSSIEEESPQKFDTIEIFQHNGKIFLNSQPFQKNENNFKKYFQTILLFEKMNFKGISLKKSIKEENLIYWLQDFQKGEAKSTPWVKIFSIGEENYQLSLKFNFLEALENSCSLTLRKKNIEENINRGGIVSYIPLREEIQKFHKSLSNLKESSLCLIPFFLKEKEKFLPFLILLNVLLQPLKFSDEIIEDILFSSFFYDTENKKKWVSLIQSKNFSNGGFLSFLSSCNHPNLLFTIFYCANKFIDFLFPKTIVSHPSEAIKKLIELSEISEEVKDYIVSILGKIPPSSPAITEECEPCLVISKNQIAVYSENKFILREGKPEKPVPYEQFPFNPLYIILNLS